MKLDSNNTDMKGNCIKMSVSLKYLSSEAVHISMPKKISLWSDNKTPHRLDTTQKKSRHRVLYVPDFWRHRSRFRTGAAEPTRIPRLTVQVSYQEPRS